MVEHAGFKGHTINYTPAAYTHIIYPMYVIIQRELPDGVIPEILMPHFVSLHQSYPGEASQESLEALQHCLKFLPEPNYNTLKFLIKHLAKVVEHTENNKMTAVSLAIVFGPNLFHCGSGLEALKMQGYSNSIVCRMIQYHDVLFVKTRKRDGSEPPKPVPYAEHVKEKRKNQVRYLMLFFLCKYV